MAKKKSNGDLLEMQDKFEAQIEGLMAEHAGQFVLMHDSKIEGFFPNRDSAYTRGLELFGPDAVFLVAEVRIPTAEPSSFAWVSGAMFVKT